MTALPSADAALDLCRRVAVCAQVINGFVFWDPGAIAAYEALGLWAPLGYAAARAAPLAPAGDAAVDAAFFTIEPGYIRLALQSVRDATTFEAVWDARNQAIVAGLDDHAPGCTDALARRRDLLWRVAEQCPLAGRTLFGAYRSLPRPAEDALSGWHALECIREWRGDTHLALLLAEDLNGIEASLLHSAWMGYDHTWIATSRGWPAEAIADGFATLAGKGLAEGTTVSRAGIALREQVERRTEQLSTAPWSSIPFAESDAAITDLEPFVEPLLARIDETAGPQYVPSVRPRPDWGVPIEALQLADRPIGESS